LLPRVLIFICAVFFLLLPAAGEAFGLAAEGAAFVYF
jgi:hypothetical protein